MFSQTIAKYTVSTFIYLFILQEITRELMIWKPPGDTGINPFLRFLPVNAPFLSIQIINHFLKFLVIVLFAIR